MKQIITKTIDIQGFRKGISIGIGIVLTLGVSAVLAVAVTGTMNTYVTGAVMDAASLNTNFASLKSAIESIPNWTKNGTSAYYTDGNVGIGTSSPQGILHLKDSNHVIPRLETTSTAGAVYHLLLGSDGLAKAAVGMDSSVGGGLIGAGSYAVSLATFSTNDVNLVTNNVRRLTILGSNGNVGIGTNSPSANLHVVGTTLATAWSTSDERYKKNIQQIENPVEKIMNLRGVNYEWKREEYKDLKFKEGKDFGFIGQEVEKVLPETIFKDNKGYLYVSYQTILPILVEAFKKQTVQMRKLSDELASVKTLHAASPRSASQQENEALKKELADMKEEISSLKRSAARAPSSVPQPSQLESIEKRLSAMERMAKK